MRDVATDDPTEGDHYLVQRTVSLPLRLDVDDGHQSGGVDLSDGVNLGAVHGVVVRAVLEVITGRDVSHHLLVCHEHVLAAVLFVASSRSRRVWYWISESLRMHRYQCVFDMSPANSMSTEQNERLSRERRQTNDLLVDGDILTVRTRRAAAAPATAAAALARLPLSQTTSSAQLCFVGSSRRRRTSLATPAAWATE